ncbi:hypothetical protein N9L94_06400 [Robiginitalea sp.]|jgi:hypothetical protein|nr:hypothetical protein [Robiginitalea sp.]
MEELYRFRQFLTEDKQLKENVEDDFKTYYERWEDEFALTNVPGVKGNVFDFNDEDEWEDDIRQPGSKIGDHSWEVSYEEEDDYYEPIINNMLNYLKKNKTYSYKNDDGVDAEFTYDDRGNSIDMSVIYSADDIEKYENKLNENKKIYKGYNDYFDKDSLLQSLGDADDAFIYLGDGKELLIYNPNSNNADNADMWGDDSVFAIDKDANEYEIDYRDIERIEI